MSGTSDRWEYHIEQIAEGIAADRLNELGAERWELVGTVPAADGGYTLIFKRNCPSLAEQITLEQRTRVQEQQGGSAS